MSFENSALLTDLYQLSMAQAYWKAGKVDTQAVFTLYFRKNPFKGGYTIAAGTQDALDYIDQFRFEREDIEYLMEQIGSDGGPVFNSGFLNYLRALKLSVNVSGVQEGTIIFPNTPVLRVEGSIIECQLLETALLNKLGFASLCATKAARVVEAAGGASVLEFGLRRAQGMGAMTASRSAYIGGAIGTSNVAAGKLYDIPIKGTHAHSFVMSFDSEYEAFEAYAKGMPNNISLLVDTYNTREGINNAIKLIKTLPTGTAASIRLDSGDLATLSRAARASLNAAGLPQTKVVASNDLDEYEILKLRERGAQIDVYGVGTMLATCYDQPALGMVYKLSALRHKKEDAWSDCVKLSEDPVKVSTPGILQTRRYRKNREMVADVVHDELSGARAGGVVMVGDHETSLPVGVEHENLVVTLLRNGGSRRLAQTVHMIRDRVRKQLDGLPQQYRRLVSPETYPVGLDANLYRNKRAKIAEIQKRFVASEAA